MAKQDQIKEYRATQRDWAINFAKSWIDSETKDYRDPKREGIPKGDPIGLSKTKYQTALYHVLYPLTFKLKDIAASTGISVGVLKVWRTQDLFKKAVADGQKKLGKLIARSIETILQKEEIETLKSSRSRSDLEDPESSVGDRDITHTEIGDTVIFLKSELGPICDYLKHHGLYNSDLGSIENIKQIPEDKTKKIRIVDDQSPLEPLIVGYKDGVDDPFKLAVSLITFLPFLAHGVGRPLIDSWAKNHDVMGYEALGLKMLEVFSVFDQKSQREWNKQPAINEINKMIAKTYIDILSQPNNIEIVGGKEELKRFIKQAKDFISSTYDILAM